MAKKFRMTIKKMKEKCAILGTPGDECWIWQARCNVSSPIVDIPRKEGGADGRVAKKVALCLVYPGLDYFRIRVRNTCGHKKCINPDHHVASYYEGKVAEKRNTPDDPDMTYLAEHTGDFILPELKEPQRRAKPLAGHLRVKAKRRGKNVTEWEMTCYHCMKHVTDLPLRRTTSGPAAQMRRAGYYGKVVFDGVEDIHLWSCPDCSERLGLAKERGDL